MRCLIALLILLFQANQIVRAQEAPASMTSLELLGKELPFDVLYGDANAPVTVVEYASLSCHHCKDFYEKVFSEAKEPYIDSGKIKFIFRHFPLNYPALRGAQLVECSDSMEKKHSIIASLFKSQEEWAYAKSEEDFLGKLKTIAKISGIGEEKFNACIADEKKEKAILENQVEAGKVLNVSATPTIFINGKIFAEERSYENFSKSLETVLAE